MKAIIEFIGAQRTGKTAISYALAGILDTGPILLLDATVDQGLTQRLLEGQKPHQTLTDLAQAFLANPAQNPEAIDWAFHELPSSVDLPRADDTPHEAELVTLGPLAAGLPESIEQMLAYGLKRLIQTYEMTVIDGYHPLLHRLVQDELMRTVVIVCPEEALLIPSDASWMHTPSLIINKYNGQKADNDLSEAIQKDDVRLIGKVPLFTSKAELEERLPEALSDCLLRMNWPIRLMENFLSKPESSGTL